MSSAPVFSPESILDTDLYKLTMQQAVLHHFPNVEATYRFTNRDKSRLFSRQSIERFRTAVSQFTDLALTPSELTWLQETCPFLTPNYLSFLSSYRYKPEQVRITFVPASPDSLFGHVEIEAFGPWIETILWEVPLMATLSECYFSFVDTDWNYDNQEQSAYTKGRALLEAGCTFSEFGTRRRRSYQTQDLVVQSLTSASRAVPDKGRFSGTSNVAALEGYTQTHSVSLDLWEAVYRESLLIALTDTFTTDAFFQDFTSDPARAERWSGLRQDSGDPFAFAPRVKAMYAGLGIDARSKALIFSDSLSVDKAVRLQKQADELGLEKVSFGIGTFLTNDFSTASSGGTAKSRALNIVIKLSSVDSKPCIKISDDLTKNTGDKATVDHVKQLYNLPLSTA
ncbi:hypothetical protein DXG01_010624 [Tephrocybe rancida]|nr:hypothetical protein DXG01_010624 [Tephrocybe rancida]